MDNNIFFGKRTALQLQKYQIKTGLNIDIGRLAELN